MLDIHFIREHLEEVKVNCGQRHVKADPDRVVGLDDERRRLAQETQLKQQRANGVAKLIRGEKDAAKKQALIAEGRQLREEVSSLEVRIKQVEVELKGELIQIPNMTHPDAPAGGTPEDNKVIRRWGEPRRFDFPAKDHVALAESLTLVDFEAEPR